MKALAAALTHVSVTCSIVVALFLVVSAQNQSAVWSGVRVSLTVSTQQAAEDGLCALCSW